MIHVIDSVVLHKLPLQLCIVKLAQFLADAAHVRPTLQAATTWWARNTHTGVLRILRLVLHAGRKIMQVEYGSRLFPPSKVRHVAYGDAGLHTGRGDADFHYTHSDRTAHQTLPNSEVPNIDVPFDSIVLPHRSRGMVRVLTRFS